MSRMTVTKSFTFDAAHKLPGYDGLCANLHGHRWTMDITVEGEINKQSGMILDFSVLKKIVDTAIISRFDHGYINDSIEMPTAEMMVLHIVETLGREMICLGTKLVRVRLYETPTSYCEWEA